MADMYLLKLAEISLKGQNRRMFEKKLSSNIKAKLKNHKSHITLKKGRLFLETDASDSLVFDSLSSVFGLAGFARAKKCSKDINEIKRTAKELLQNSLFKDDGSTFRVRAKREDKNFEMSSYQLSCALAEVINSLYPSLSVDLDNAQYTLYVEIRDSAYLYTTSFKSLSGLPVGTAGKALCLLSGGIDSPVASFMMASRGLRQELIYFHSFPYTGEEALQKVKSLAQKLSVYLGGTILHVVNFTPMQQRIMNTVEEREKTLMLRSAMMRVAKKLSIKRRCTAIITGEALAQVASQTLEAMNFTTYMTDFLVLRPLVGMDKEEIIKIARNIGTYETSILPYADCCSLFSPKHPLTKPVLKREVLSYQKMDAEEIENEAVETEQVFFYDECGCEK